MANGRRAVRRVVRGVGAHFGRYKKLGMKVARASGLSLRTRRAIVHFGLGAALYYAGGDRKVKPISPKPKLRKRR